MRRGVLRNDGLDLAQGQGILGNGTAGSWARFGVHMERLIARIPLALMLGAILLCVQLSLVQTNENSRIVAAVPLVALVFFYLRAGRQGSGDE